MEREHDFTRGPILSSLLRFALPVLLALLLQAMYGAVDLQVVGKFGTAADISAVSTGSQIMQTITIVITGLAMGVTVLLGDNGQGKTNVLEAVYLTCTGRSHRTRQDRELIRWGADFADVKIRTERRDGSHEVEIVLPAAGKRRIKVAGQEV